MPDYRLVQRFKRFEAVGMRGAPHGDSADPVWLEVVVTRSDDADVVIEQVAMQTAGQDQLKRQRMGVWTFQLDPSKYEIGQSYTASWRFGMHPETSNVSHESFVWNPLPEVPDTPSECVLYGLLADSAGLPVANERIVMEEYRDYVTLSHRLGSLDLVSDVFGYWSVQLPYGTMRRFVLGDLSKIIQVPAKARAALGELPGFQPKDIVRVDSYGYPMPGQDLYAMLRARLTSKEALAVLQSVSVVKYVNEITDACECGEDGVEIYTHEQVAPSTVWVITHGRDCTPILSVLDTDNDVMYPEVSYPDRDTVILTFSQSMAGKAVLICGPEVSLTG